jgi:hypothetical protein
LIEHQSHGVWTTIQENLLSLNADRAQRGVGGDFVEYLPVAQKLHLDIDQRRGFRRPQQLVAIVVDSGIGKADPAMDF